MRRITGLTFAVVVSLMCASAWGASWSEKVKAANIAYNEGKYDDARKQYIAVIQQNPREAVPYRNLARTLFWKGAYPEAVVYYDNYLRLAGSNAKDLKQIESERKLANERASGSVWTLPEEQQAARDALQKEVDAGRVTTKGGGGALAVYQSLLRTGYAQPDLAEFRTLLSRGLLNLF